MQSVGHQAEEDSGAEGGLTQQQIPPGRSWPFGSRRDTSLSSSLWSVTHRNSPRSRSVHLPLLQRGVPCTYVGVHLTTRDPWGPEDRDGKSGCN